MANNATPVQFKLALIFVAHRVHWRVCPYNEFMLIGEICVKKHYEVFKWGISLARVYHICIVTKNHCSASDHTTLNSSTK